jgi:hypothetical protein
MRVHAPVLLRKVAAMYGANFLPTAAPSPLSDLCPASFWDTDSNCSPDIWGIPITFPIIFVAGFLVLAAYTTYSHRKTKCHILCYA